MCILHVLEVGDNASMGPIMGYFGIIWYSQASTEHCHFNELNVLLKFF